MVERVTALEGQIGIAEHPAVRAWRHVQPDSPEPGKLEALWQGRRRRRGKSEVYCLHGVGSDSSCIVAKRCHRTTAAIERTVYTEILARLPWPGLVCHGMVEDDNTEFCWVFLDDAGDKQYSPSDSEHRALASRWLGAMHVATARVAGNWPLPDRGPLAYRNQLRAARQRIALNSANPALRPDDREVLRCVDSLSERLESRWDRLDTFCAAVPRTLVHADFVEKNLRLRTDCAGLAFFAFDWEFCGWGAPAPDLAECPDLSEYQAVVRDAWPTLGSGDIRQLATVGGVFRRAAELDWLSWSLAYEWLDRPMARLREWRLEIDGLIARLDL